MNCYGKAEPHPLVEILRAGGGDWEASSVVRWCPRCGAIVVDYEFDGRVSPGAVEPMRFPSLIQKS